MSLNRYAQRRDANEHELVTLAKQLGARVVIAGPLDCWVSHRGVWVPVEIKTAKGKYTSDQALFMQRSKETGDPVWTWRNTDDVMSSLGARITA